MLCPCCPERCTERYEFYPSPRACCPEVTSVAPPPVPIAMCIPSVPAPTLPNTVNTVPPSTPFGAYNLLGFAVIPSPLVVDRSHRPPGLAPGAPPLFGFSSSNRPLVGPATSASPLIRLDQTTPLVPALSGPRP